MQILGICAFDKMFGTLDSTPLKGDDNIIELTFTFTDKVEKIFYKKCTKTHHLHTGLYEWSHAMNS